MTQLVDSEAAPRPVRVIHLLPVLTVGGTELGVVKLANTLDPAFVTSSICSTRPADSARQRLASHVPLFELRRRDGNDLVLVYRLYRLFREQRPDIVHTHAWGTLLEGLAAARLARVPIVIHGEHGTLELKPRQVRAQQWGWKRVDRLLSVSSRLAQRMSREVGVPLDRITVIRNGVDIDKFQGGNRVRTRAELRVRPDELVVGTVGRLVPVKDHGTLLQSLQLLQRRAVRFKAFIVGEGELRQELSDRIRGLGLTDRVQLLGNRLDIEHIFSALDIFVLSSVSEGLSNTIQEAMAARLPVVATDVGGADELVDAGHTGLLVRPGDPQALASALRQLLVSPELRQSMAEAGGSRARVEFGVDRMVSAYADLYLELARQVGSDARVPTAA